MPEGHPNYLSTAADGTVTADFTGGILLTRKTNIVEELPQIRWKRETDGALVADIFAVSNGGSGSPSTISTYRVYTPGTEDSPTNSSYISLSGGIPGAQQAQIGSGYPEAVGQGLALLDVTGAPNALAGTPEVKARILQQSPDPDRSVRIINYNDESDLLRATSDICRVIWDGSAAIPNISIPRAGKYVPFFDGSCWNTGALGVTGFDWYMDGNYFGTQRLYFNLANVHMGLVWTAQTGTPLSLTAGNHTLTAVGLGALAYDVYDRFQFTLIRVGNL